MAYLLRGPLCVEHIAFCACPLTRAANNVTGSIADVLKMLLRRQPISILIALALLSGSLAVLPTAKALATEHAEPPPITSLKTPNNPESVSGDFSVPDEPPPPQPPHSGGERAFEGYSAEESDEITGERRETAKVFSNPDGTRTEKIYSEPIHYKDAAGDWKEIDARVVSDGAGFRNAGGPIDFRFKSTANSPDLLTASVAGAAVSFAFRGAAPSQGLISGSTLKYPNVFPNVDLEYRLHGAGLKELVVLKSPPPRGLPVRFEFDLTSSGLTPRKESDGSIGLSDEVGVMRMRIPQLSAWDSSADPSSGEPARTPIQTSLSQDGERWLLTIEADGSWFTSPARVYPVFVDPDIETNVNGDAFVTSASPNANYNVFLDTGLNEYVDRIGFSNSGTGTNWTYLWYDFGSVTGKTILSATWNGYFLYLPPNPNPTYWIRPATCCWNANTITWNNRPPQPADFLNASADLGWNEVDITNWVGKFAGGTWQNNGLQLDANGNGSAHYKKLAAQENGLDTASYVSVTYNTPPSVTEVPPVQWTHNLLEAGPPERGPLWEDETLGHTPQSSERKR